jgi:Tol biopolymer transport system component
VIKPNGWQEGDKKMKKAFFLIPAVLVFSISVAFGQVGIVVDGYKDAFYETLTGPNDGYLQIRSYAYNDNGAPVNDADLSAKVWTAWDSTWFYLYTEVVDDTVSGAGTSNPWEGDDLELKIDPIPRDSTRVGSNYIFDMRLSAPFAETGGVVDTSLRSSIAAADKKSARRLTSNGYALELAVKWSAIKVSGSDSVHVGVDSVFGFGLMVHDNDGNPARPRQASITWAAVLLNHIWDTPKYLGTVKFLSGNRLSFIPANNMTGVTNPIPYDGSDYEVFAQVTFRVDMGVYISSGIFNPSRDSLFLRGSFNGWNPANRLASNGSIYATTIALPKRFQYQYKFWMNSPGAPNSGWEGFVGPEPTYGNREVTVATNDTTLPVVFFNGVTSIPPPDNATLFYSSTNYSSSPVPSPNGDMVTFFYSTVADFNGHRDALVADVTPGFSSTNVRPLSSNSSGAYGNWGPVWRLPSGAEIYFLTDRAVYWDLMKTDIATMTESFVLRIPAYQEIGSPRFSPDGSHFVADYLENNVRTIRIFSADGSTQTTLHTTGSPSLPDWSPDGSRILFTSNDTIYTMKTDGSDLQSVFCHRGRPQHARWSPDGSKIAFSAMIESSIDIWVIDTDGSNLRRITTHLQDDLEPEWDGMNKRIYFRSNRTTVHADILSIDVSWLWQMPSSCVTPPSGLVSWWDGDGDANDLMNRNQGTMVNGATFATGLVGQAFGFDGVDDYVSAPGMSIDSLQQLTIEAWVKLNSMPPRIERFVSIWGEKAVLRYDGGNGPGQLHFYMVIDGLGRHIRVNNVLLTGVFYHVAGTYDGSVMRLYLDGVDVGSLAVAGTVGVGGGVLLSTSGEPLDGLLDEAAIYNRALSSAEIQAIYFAGSFGKCKTFAQLPAPALVSPTNGATGIPPSPTFEWSAVAGATSYRLQVSNDSTFSSIVIDQWNLTSTSQAISGLSISRTYYWRVNATDAGPASDWSLVWNFTTLGGSVFSPTADNLGITTANGQFGCAWGDYDGDGYLDLYIPGQEQTNVLYKNTNGQHFTDVSTAAGLAGPFGKQATGAIWFDFDNDGDLDLLTTDLGLRLYRNDNGTFTDISSITKLDTVQAGVALWQAAAGDFDKDGDMDIAFAGGNGQAFPMHILNNNHGVFEDVTNALVPSPTPVLESWNPCWVDVNNDGNLDLWMPTIRAMSQGCKILINQGGTFVIADSNATGIKARSAITSAWGDFDNDGDMDLFLVPYSSDNDGVAKLYRNNGNGTFTDVAQSLGLDSAFADSRGVYWGDYDNDGDLDLLIGRRTSPQKLYRNDGGTFTEVGLETGAGAVGWGDGFRSVVFVDYDNDGFLDLYYNGMGNKLLLHNAGNSNHWIGIKLRGTTDNTAGIGARITVVSGSLTQVRDIQAGAGGITNGFLWGHFGLGTRASVDSVVIMWPSGTVEVHRNVVVDHYNTFTESSTNNSAFLDGASRIRVLDDAPINPSANPNAYKITGTAITVEAWVYPVDVPPAGESRIIVARPANGGINVVPFQTFGLLAIGTAPQSGQPRLGVRISDGASAIGSSNETFVEDTSPIALWQWTHVAGTYDGSMVKLYINGVLVNQLPLSVGIGQGSTGFYIGGFSSEFFRGLIDEVRLWNVARSQADIQASMDTTLLGNESGMAGYWPLDETYDAGGGVVAVTDKTPNHNDLQVWAQARLVAMNPLMPGGTPAFTVSPSPLDFGIEEQGTTVSRTLSITNTTINPLIGKYDRNSTDVAIMSNNVFFVGGGQTVDVPVSVCALVAGSVTSGLTMTTNAPSPVTIPISMTSIALRQFNANNISMWMLRDGEFARDYLKRLSTPTAGFEWPRGSGKTAIYASGIWIGAQVGGSLRTATAAYSSEFQAGPIINGVVPSPNDVRYRVYKIDAGDNASTNPDYAEWPADLGAPVNSDGTPRVIGDQTLFAVYNDLNQSRHYLGSAPLGAEVQQTTFGFNQPGTQNNTVFVRFKVINRSMSNWDNAYIALWSDPDLGDFTDDYVGIDTAQTLGYCYNATDFDTVYHSAPPAVGYKILKGAFFGKPVQAFARYTNAAAYPDGDPHTAQEAYNYMRGTRQDGSAFIDPTTSQPTRFPFSGDPVAGTGWIDTNPGDRRFLFSTGPFALEPGQSKEFIAAIIVGQGSSNINSITALRTSSEEVQSLFDAGQIFGGALGNVTIATVPPNDTSTVNDVSNSGAELMVAAGSGGATVEVASYVAPPPGSEDISAASISGVGKYVEVNVGGDINWPVEIKVYYTANDLAQAGVAETDLRGLYYWSGAEDEWRLYSNSGADDQGRGVSTTGVNTTNISVDGIDYEGYVSTTAYHLTPMRIGTGITGITHSIVLPQGWNMNSSFVAPRDSTLDTMMVKISPHLVLMKNGGGQIYTPLFGGINTIGKWNPRHGYKIYMSAADTVTITGIELHPESTPLQLAQGWNLSAYLRNSPMSTDSAMAGIVSSLVIVKDNGGHIYTPLYGGINTIGQMKPGQGYQMYLTQASTLSYPANTGPTPPSILTKQSVVASTTGVSSPVHYTSSVSNTGANAILFVESSDLKEGDEVGVWTEKKMLVGSGVVHQGRAVITIWGDNTITEDIVDGAVDGESLSLTAWSSGEKEEKSLSISSLQDALTGKQVENVLCYKTDGVWIAQGVKESKEIPTTFSLSQNYPNPFNPSTTIKYGLPKDVKVTLEVYNILGQRVAMLVDEEQKAGYYEVVFQNANLASGVYFYRIQASMFSEIRKMVLVR